jgi:predicted dehydrogenase
MKLAVVGLGFMGSTHLQAYRNIPEVELIAVSSNDPVKLSGDLSEIKGNLGGSGEKLDFSGLRKYANYREVCADPDIEAVDLCLPTDLHAPAAIAALNAGKHVLVEKPMAINEADCDAMLAAAEKSGKVLMVAQVLRFIPSYVALHGLLSSGSLGPVHAALFRRRCAAPGWSKWLADPKRGGGGVFDLLIHDVDMALHLFGQPEAISATGYEELNKGIDQLTANLYYPAIEGAVTITGGWHHPKAYPFSMEYTVVAEEGTVDFSSAGRPTTLYRADGEEEAVKEPSTDGFEAELAYFISTCVAGKQPDNCPPSESAHAVALTQALVELRKEKGVKSKWKSV